MRLSINLHQLQVAGPHPHKIMDTIKQLLDRCVAAALNPAHPSSRQIGPALWLVPQDSCQRLTNLVSCALSFHCQPDDTHSTLTVPACRQSMEAMPPAQWVAV